MKIVVDAMGGDHAPENVVAGAVDAVNAYRVPVALVGIAQRVEAELKKYKYPQGLIEIVHAPEIVAMDDHAIASIRQKKNSSITVGVGLLKKGGYDAFISAGNTGAVVAASTVVLGMIPGVDRPGIGCVIPTLKKFSFMIDLGANTAAKPEHLLQYAKMAKVYARLVLEIPHPSVGLLNIGAEEGKGTELEKEAHKILEEREPDFIGNIEANEIFTGKAHCVVCDGYVGNVALKVSEGLMESVAVLMKREIKKNPIAILGALLLKSSLSEARRSIDYSEYGGAPLLGVDGLVLISHGRSSPKAIRNAIRAAIREVEHDVLGKIKEEAVK
ncbi:MAG TPA: phosphate acyltransferase PlsX [Candidatus Omnitrophota bacterium]|nr:phosphate acyltransferase PlsX [Candidatus Omnitrophota bacterium]